MVDTRIGARELSSRMVLCIGFRVKRECQVNGKKVRELETPAEFECNLKQDVKLLSLVIALENLNR